MNPELIDIQLRKVRAARDEIWRQATRDCSYYAQGLMEEYAQLTLELYLLEAELRAAID